MHQLSFTTHSKEETLDAIKTLKAQPYYHDGAVVFADLMIGDRHEDMIGKLCQLLREEIPGIQIAGLTSAYEIDKGLQLNDNTDLVVISFIVFESAQVKVVSYDQTQIPSVTIAHKLMEEIRHTEDAVCLRLYINASQIMDAADFFNTFTLEDPDLLVAGGVASGDLSFDVPQIFVTGTEGPIKNGYVAAIFSGKELHAKSIFTQGWVPSGIAHTITKMDGQELLEIDDVPVVEFYEKYIGVKVSKNLPFEILEFPLMVERHGIQVARAISGMTERYGLIAPSDLHVGDTVHLSLAIISDMLDQSRDLAQEMAQFQPQTMFLTVCLNRNLYLQDTEQRELDFYRSVSPEVTGCSCYGELTRIGDHVFWLNCALVTMVMREGELDTAKKVQLVKGINREEYGNRVPLLDKIARFMKVSTAEFVEMQEKQRELELEQQVIAEKAANEAKSEFLSNMSHEIRTPINSVLGMDEMILREAKEEKIREYAEDIRNAGNTLLFLINDILDFSKIEAGRLEIINSTYSLSSLIYDIEIMTQKKASDKGLELKLDIDPTLPDECVGDEVRLRQILLNIMNNAVKYTNDGYVKMTARYAKVDEDSVELTFHVMDTGIGIKKEDLSRLFSPFERIEEKRNRTIEGTGLGMAITKSLLQMMDSKLEVKSTYGRGSDFYFTVKQEVANWAPIGDFIDKARDRSRRKGNTKEVYHAPKAQILVVDDTPMNLTVIRNLLRRIQVQVDTEESGMACLEAISKKKYDMIFMDHRMPLMDGTETMQKIRALPVGSLNQDTPIIVLTANAVAGMKEKFLSDGFDAYLSKPVDPKELEDTVRSFLPNDKVITSLEEDKQEKSTDDPYADIEDPEVKAILIKAEDIPQLRVNKAIKNCGDPQTYVKLLRDFAMSAESKKQELRGFIENDNLKDFTTKVHALKTSARLIGALDFSEMCRKFEEAGDNGDFEFIKARFEYVMEWFEDLIVQVVGILPQEDDSDKQLIGDYELLEAYGAIVELVSALDFESADMIMENLSMYRIPDVEKERFNELKMAMASVDQQKVLEILG